MGSLHERKLILLKFVTARRKSLRAKLPKLQKADCLIKNQAWCLK